MRKRSSSPGSNDGPSQKRFFADENKRILEEWKQLYKQVDTSRTVMWSGTVKIPDSQKIVFDCSIKAHPQDEGIKSLFPPKQLTMRILPVSVVLSLYPYQVDSKCVNLRTDENTDMMSYSAFSQAIRLGSGMRGYVVLKNTASALHLLYLSSYHEDNIRGFIVKYTANATVLGILRSHDLLPCVNSQHEELVKQITRLKEELQYKDKKLTEQQKLNQELVKMHKKEMEEKEGKHEDERNRMEEQITERERKIITLDKEIKNVRLEKKKLVTDLYGEFQCSICHETIIKAHYLPCKHVFCKICIEEWWKTETTCPSCRCKAEIPIPYPGFDKVVDRVIKHFGKKAKEARDDAVKNCEAFIELKNELSFLLSSEELEGQSATSEGESVTSDGESVTSEGESVTSERESVTLEGESVISEEESVTSEGESMTSEEEEMVPEHSCRVTELEASFVGPRESSADRTSEESLSEAAEGEQLHREPEEIQTPSFFSTHPPFLPLSSPSSSEDEPSLS